MKSLCKLYQISRGTVNVAFLDAPPIRYSYLLNGLPHPPAAENPHQPLTDEAIGRPGDDETGHQVLTELSPESVSSALCHLYPGADHLSHTQALEFAHVVLGRSGAEPGTYREAMARGADEAQ